MMSSSATAYAILAGMNELIQQLDDLRKKLGWSQERMAQEVGVSFSTYNRWVQGHIQKLHGPTKRVIELVLEKYSDKAT